MVAGSPGQVLTQSVALRNDGNAPIDLRLAGVDSATAQFGGSSFALESDKPVREVGRTIEANYPPATY